MRKLITVSMLWMILLNGCAKTPKVIAPTDEISYFAHVTMAVDETDPYVYTGTMDYVFAGTVKEVLRNVIDPKDRKDKGESCYAVHVERNLKGTLEEEIEVRKKGGVDRNGVMQLLESDSRKDTGLPIAGKTYIFMAYAQQDGSLLLSEFFDQRECSEELIAEYEEYIANEIPSERERFHSVYERKKEILRLNRWLDLSVHGPEKEPVYVPLACSAEGLEETEWTEMDPDLIPEEMKDQLRKDFPDLNLDGWQMMIHYYDEEKTAGILQLRYQIGRIITTRAVSAHISDGRITAMYYTDMDGEAEEADLLRRVQTFEEMYEQEKYPLGENEKFLDETATYTYDCSTEKLIYTYNLFFEEESGVINNSIGCEYEIPEY